MTTISLPKLNENVVSVSATKAQTEAAKYLFGKNYLKILANIELLAKSKLVLSPHLRGLMLMLRDAEDDEIIKFPKTVSGKATIKAVQDLAKAKTLDASLKAFKLIKVAKKWHDVGAKTDVAKIAKPVPKVKERKAKPAPAEKPVLKVGEEVKSNTPAGTPQIPDHHNKANDDTKFGKVVNEVIATFGNAGYPLQDHDVLQNKVVGGYQVRVYPKVTNNPREDLAYAVMVHKDGTFSYGVYDKNSKGETFGSDTNLRKAVSRLIHFIETQNPTNANAFIPAFGKGKAKDDHKSETVLVDEISDVLPQTLDKKFEKYVDHLKAIADNLKRNIPGLRTKLLPRGLEFIMGQEEFGTLKFGDERWLLTPYKRVHKTVDVGQYYDAGYVIQTLKEMFEADRKRAARKEKTHGVTDNLMLKYKQDMTSALASSGLKLFDEVHNAKETNDDNLVWDMSYRMPETGISLPVSIRYNRRKGYSFGLNGAPYTMIQPGVAQNIGKFIRALKSTIDAVVKGSSKKYALADGRPFTPGTGVLHAKSKTVDIRCTQSAIFLTGNPAAVSTLFDGSFKQPLLDSNGTATVNRSAPNNYRILCNNEAIRDQILMGANIIRKL